MPLVEEISPNAPRRPTASSGGGHAPPSGAPPRGSTLGAPPGEDLPPEVAEAMAQMDEWRAADPEGFEAMMAATLASKQAGDDPEASMAKLEKLMAAQQAAQVAQQGLELPGKKKVSLDGKVQEQDVAGVDITPTPGFVVKTLRVGDNGSLLNAAVSNNTGSTSGASGGGGKVDGSSENANKPRSNKVFLNLCSARELAEPHLKKKLNEQGEEVEGWNVPLAVGPPRACSDHKGEVATVFDCVVNPKVIGDAEADTTGTDKDFLVQLALQYVESKYKVTLDRRYKLPKLAYKADDPNNPKAVAKQRVKDMSKAPKISEVLSTQSSSDDPYNSSNSNSSNRRRSAQRVAVPPPEAKKLSYGFFHVQADGTEIADPSRSSTSTEGSNGSEREPLVRPNDVDDSGTLPRRMLLKCGPLCPAAVEALTNTATEELEWKAEDGEEEGSKKKDNNSVAIEVSCYECTVKLPGHIPLQVVFPYAAVAEEEDEDEEEDADGGNNKEGGESGSSKRKRKKKKKKVAAEAEATLHPHDAMLEISVAVDPSSYALSADPGCRPWLLAQALEGGGDGRSESESNTHKSATNDASSGTAAAANSLNPTKLAAAAEDKFHLRAKKKGGVDPSTGLLERDEEPVDEDEELPEDRFHRDDALSAHYISQREGDRKEKRDRAEKEREDRKARQASGKTDGIDDHIDYIDVEDFRPGGKFGPPAIDVGAARDALTGVAFEESEDMKNASKVLLSAGSAAGANQISSEDTSSSTSTSTNTSAAAVEAAGALGVGPAKLAELKSTVWADLLD